MDEFSESQRKDLIGAFHRGCCKLGHYLSDDIINYGINTIERFIRDDDEKLHEPLISNYFRQEADGAMPLRDVADASLITSGFFPPSDRALKKYIEKVGRSAYGDLAHKEFVINVIFRKMEMVYGAVADAMGYIKIDGPLESDNIRMMSEKLEQEKDPRLTEILKEAIFSRAPVIV